MGEAEASSQGQAFGKLPVGLPKYSKGLSFGRRGRTRFEPVECRIGNGLIGGREVPQRCRRTIAHRAIAAHDLPEVIEPGDIAERSIALRGDAQFLAELALPVGLLVVGNDRQCGSVTIVGRIPVPPAIG